MIYQHKYFQLDTEGKKIFDENGKELVLTGNAYRMLVFLCANKNANLTKIGEFLDHAKEYSENHLRQYRYKINAIIGKAVLEYKNGVYSIAGEIKKTSEIRKNDRNTDLLQYDPIESKTGLMEKLKEIKFTRWPAIIASILLLLSFLSWPYAYYQFLRIAITGIAVYYAYYFYTNKQQNFWFWVFVMIAILFNPIAPIYIKGKSTWIIIDVFVAVFFIISIIRKKHV